VLESPRVLTRIAAESPLCAVTDSVQVRPDATGTVACRAPTVRRAGGNERNDIHHAPPIGTTRSCAFLPSERQGRTARPRRKRHRLAIGRATTRRMRGRAHPPTQPVTHGDTTSLDTTRLTPVDRRGRGVTQSGTGVVVPRIPRHYAISRGAVRVRLTISSHVVNCFGFSADALLDV
jgi:hypothetical protein